MCIIIKLLGLADDKANLHNGWMWGLLGFSICASISLSIQWHIMSKISFTPLVVSINSDEAEPLLVDRTNGKPDEDSESEEKVDRSSVFRLFSFSKPDWMYISGAFTFLVISSTGKIFLPYYTGEVINGIAIEKSQSKFTSALINMSLISIASAVASGLRGGLFSTAMARLSNRIRNLLFSSILKQEIGFFDTIRTGDVVSRLTSDTATMSDTLSLNMNVFLRSLITAIGVIVFMFRISWRMSLVTFAGLPIIFVVSKIYGNYYEKLSEQVQDSLAKANNVAEEACSTMRTVRSFANELGEIARYYKALMVTYKLDVKLAMIYGGYSICNQLFELALTVSTLYYGGHLVIKGELSGGNLVSFILYQIQLGDSLDDMADVYTGLMQSLGASHKVFQYIDRIPNINLNDGGYKPLSLDGKIEFKDVSFSYPSRADCKVLKNVSFTVDPGEVVALVGPSGGGKSSIVNLLQHFYEPQSGEVLLDGVKINNYSHDFLHRKLAMVGQEPVLYARTIGENIAYGLEEEFTQTDIERAARLANAHDFISKMTKTYETETGEKGLQISGGQKQRIAIARALIRNPVVLVLDEATSALDSESEHVVQQAIYDNVKGRTVIIIAHRLSTVEAANRILVINHGEVVEQGRHQELLHRGGMYANLVKRQLNTITDDPIKETSQIVVPEVKTKYGSTESHKSLSKYGSVDSHKSLSK
ncbi:hypothetical protein SNE40_002588 [Patella caerulea]